MRNSINLKPVCTSMYRTELNKTLMMYLNLKISVSARAHAQLSNMHGAKGYLMYQMGKIVVTISHIHINCHLL